ncbi:LEA type 2 family protein [Luteimonas lutimaris]|uniref:LEA type 2 family protein n=1 Tax=Luteimonas lutimaris TaxID=698645 RepID=A0ABP7MTV3_9GAMM|nr:LEA type 2 family protein [Luteimonas sp.]
MHRQRFFVAFLATAAMLLLASCSNGPVRRISEPSASIQQLTVRADGSWSVDLRLQNYSSIPMRFGAISLAVTLGEQPAGTLTGNAGISIGPESADVVTLEHAPTSAGRIAIADALGGNRAVGYALQGTLQAAPEDRSSSRSYDIKHTSALNPVPGLPGVLR